MKKYKLTPKDITKAVYYAPDARSHRSMARELGFNPATQVQEPMFDSVGNTGAALAPTMLVAALEKAKPGDRILLANYGDGADAFLGQDQADKAEAQGDGAHQQEQREPSLAFCAILRVGFAES